MASGIKPKSAEISDAAIFEHDLRKFSINSLRRDSAHEKLIADFNELNQRFFKLKTAFSSDKSKKLEEKMKKFAGKFKPETPPPVDPSEQSDLYDKSPAVSPKAAPTDFKVNDENDELSDVFV